MKRGLIDTANFRALDFFKFMISVRQIAWSLYGLVAWDKNRNIDITNAVLSVILSFLKTGKKDEKVLDAGCGTGYYASKLSQHAFRVTGIDYAAGYDQGCET